MKRHQDPRTLARECLQKALESANTEDTVGWLQMAEGWLRSAPKTENRQTATKPDREH